MALVNVGIVNLVCPDAKQFWFGAAQWTQGLLLGMEVGAQWIAACCVVFLLMVLEQGPGFCHLFTHCMRSCHMDLLCCPVVS
jgi:hypothetical protein